MISRIFFSKKKNCTAPYKQWRCKSP